MHVCELMIHKQNASMPPEKPLWQSHTRPVVPCGLHLGPSAYLSLALMQINIVSFTNYCAVLHAVTHFLLCCQTLFVT